MRLSPLLIIAAAAAAQQQNSTTFSSKAAKSETSLTGNEVKKNKKKARQEKRKKKAEAARLKLEDPLLELKNEIETLSELEGELADEHLGVSNSLSEIDGSGEIAAAVVVDGPAADCTKVMCQYELTPDFMLEYKVNVPEDTTTHECVGCSLRVKLTYEGTAWLAFALSTNGEMIGSEAVIGHPLMEGTEPGKYYLGGKYDGGIQPMEDEKQTLINATILFENGQSILEFEKLMKEDGEIEISSGLNTFLWAHGEDNSMSTYHGNNRSPFQLNLLGIDEEDSIGEDITSTVITSTGENHIVTTTLSSKVADEDSTDSAVSADKVDVELPPCPSAYDPSRKYTAGDQVEVGNYIWECREYPHDLYCSIPDFHPSLTEENPNAEDLWLNAWSKSVGECTKPLNSPTSVPLTKLSGAPSIKATGKDTPSPSEIILTALPTQSPMSDDGLPYPVPELRFIEWGELGLHEQSVAESLGYSRYSWNNLEVLDLEEESFRDLSESEQQGAITLGFDEDTWDCYMSHYYNYYWSELEEAKVAQHFATLGWTQSSWDNDGEAPDSDDKTWNELTKEEQLAATKICYVENAWDWVPLRSW